MKRFILSLLLVVMSSIVSRTTAQADEPKFDVVLRNGKIVDGTGAPWYYGGLPGIEDVDYLIVPLCPLIPAVRALVLEAVDEANIPLTEIRRTPLYILYSVDLT